MGKPAARLGDMTAHGGSIVVGFPTVLIGGMPAARIGDMHVCPMLNPGVPPPPHVGGPISLGSPTVLIGGMPAARMGDMVVCAGPPDSIVMGCPTVLIGEAGGGSASGGGAGSTAAANAEAAAANALTNNLEASTKEKNWIEFELVDKAGNPVCGENYKLSDSDGKDSESLLRVDGRIRRDALSEGECKVKIRSLFNAKWSKDTAKAGDKIELSVESEELDDGEKVTFDIWKRDILAADALIKSIETTISGNKAKTEWEYVIEKKNDKNKNDDSVKKYSSPDFYFTVTSGPFLHTRSGYLYYEDIIEIELKDSDNKPLANEEYMIYLMNGEVRKGKLNDSGYMKEEKIPGGTICSIKFPKLSRFKEE